jgi:hypothetical protein
MNEFFETEFGSELKPHLEKTKQTHQGQSVYKVKRDIPEYKLDRGDQLYLDGMHKDHIEIFNQQGKCKKVLNLDGTLNEAKSRVARNRRIA